MSSGAGVDVSNGLDDAYNDPYDPREEKDSDPVVKLMGRKTLNPAQKKFVDKVKQRVAAEPTTVWFDPLATETSYGSKAPDISRYYARPVFVVAPHLQAKAAWGHSAPVCCKVPVRPLRWVLPQHGHGRDRSFVVLQFSYACAVNNHYAYATDASVMAALPDWLTERYRRYVTWLHNFNVDTDNDNDDDDDEKKESQRTGRTVFFDRDLVEFVYDTQDIGLDFGRVRRMLQVSKSNHYLRVVQRYLGDCEQRLTYEENCRKLGSVPPSSPFAVFSRAGDTDGYNEIEPPVPNVCFVLVCVRLVSGC